MVVSCFPYEIPNYQQRGTVMKFFFKVVWEW